MSNLNFLQDMGISVGMVQDIPAVHKIKAQLFEVEKVPAVSPRGGFDAPELVHIYKTTGGACLGTAKDSYAILQPADFFESISLALAKVGFKFEEDKIEYLPIKNDQVISFKIHLDTIEIKNKRKVGDVTNVYALFTTSFDGSLSTCLAIYVERLVCSNGMVRKEKGAFKAFRHTTNSNARALAYANTIAAMAVNMQSYKELYVAMNNLQLTSERVDELLTEITGYNVKEYAQLHKTQQKIVDGIREAQAIEFGRTGATAFGLLNAFTYYTNHDDFGNLRGKDYVMFGTGDQLNTKAQKVLEGLVTN